MIKIKTLFLNSLLLAAMLFTSCSSDEVQPSGESLIALSVQADAGFQSRALNEASYENLDNYTVQLLKDGEVNQEWSYAKLPQTLKVDAGSYQLKAFYGEDTPVSVTAMYVEGVSEPLEVTGTEKDPLTLSTVCKPVCAKVTVNFSEDMDTYFSDYSVVIKTSAMSADETFVWKKTDTDPVYLKVNDKEQVTMNITLVKIPDETSKAGETTIVDKVYELSPKQAMTLKVAPVVTQEEGKLGIKIEIDESTNDHEMDVTVPGEWK